MSFRRILIANRGEIAVRVIRACRMLGIETCLAVSAADRDSLGARLADRVVCIGPARALDSYLCEPAILQSAVALGVDAVHPGYGFLSERASFVEACERNGLGFVGPSAPNVRLMGDKLEARALASRLGVPVVPGSPSVATFRDADRVIAEIGLPILIKAAAGGGGRGIRVVRTREELRPIFEAAAAEAAAAFSDGTLFVERYVERARHLEVQVFGDRTGRVVEFGARDCSVQRRYQKVVEEALPPALSPSTAEALRAAAVQLATGISYENAGTVEFVYDVERDEFYFLEMNTRIQVEHPVTEEVTGVDLVRLQLEVAAGATIEAHSRARAVGHAIECRLNAESPEHGFRPSPGRITSFSAPAGPGVRVDSHVYPGYVVPPFYDSLVAKVITSGASRAEACARMRGALDELVIEGIDTNLALLRSIVSDPQFTNGPVTTSWLEANLDRLVGPESPTDA